MRELSTSCALVRSNRKSSTFWMSPYPGEVWLADLGMVAKTRPVVIVCPYRRFTFSAVRLPPPMVTRGFIST
jgi:hypothetical protein